jgi:hypothetical protein
MNTNRNMKKNLVASAVGLAVAGVMAPAALVFGAGTAQADAFPPKQPFYSPVYGPGHVVYANAPFGLDVDIDDQANPPGATETCTYSSIGVGPTPPIPFFGSVVLKGHQPSSLCIPGVQMGNHWAVTVSCPHAGSRTFDEKY